MCVLCVVMEACVCILVSEKRERKKRRKRKKNFDFLALDSRSATTSVILGWEGATLRDQGRRKRGGAGRDEEERSGMGGGQSCRGLFLPDLESTTNGGAEQTHANGRHQSGKGSFRRRRGDEKVNGRFNGEIE